MRVKRFDLLLVKIGCFKNLLIQISLLIYVIFRLDNTFYIILLFGQLLADLLYIKVLDLSKRNL